MTVFAVFWKNKAIYVKRIDQFCYYADINNKFV